MSKLPSASEILIVDDESDLRELYELTLTRQGYQVDTVPSVDQAIARLDAHRYDLVITDMRLDDGLGLALIEKLQNEQRSEQSIVITAYGSAENAVQALKHGAFDYLTKPVDLKQLRQVVSAAIRSKRQLMDQTGKRSGSQKPEHMGPSPLIGRSTIMQDLRERIAKVANSMAPILILGESGTGKELAARELHAQSHRAAHPMVIVNCGAIPEALLEAEFFGAKKGAFTGAHQDRDGFFQAAAGGTLFLDEIGDLPLSMQPKLLRAIQERRVRPLGSTQEQAIDVRIVSATHKDIEEEVRAGRFRQDLFYRLNVINLWVPPLRDRREDLPDLCAHLLQRIRKEAGTAIPDLPVGALKTIQTLPLSGNVRELENLLHRLAATGEWNIRVDETSSGLPHALVPDTAATPEQEPTERAAKEGLQAYLDNLERDILQKTLAQTKFNRTSAAAILGISLRQIRYRIDRLNISTPGSDDDNA